MHYSLIEKRFVRFYLGFLLIAFLNISFAAQFLADMTETVDNEARVYKIYVRNDLYRMELEEEGNEVIVLVDQASGITRVLMPAEMMYMEMASDDMQSLMNDPFQAAKYTEKMGEKVKIGLEIIDGYDCDVYVIRSGDDELMKMWFSEKLGFALKIAITGENVHAMELGNIEVKNLDDKLFVMPAGYTKMSRPKERVIELPAWAERVASAEYVKPPFQQMMLDEEIVRVKVVAGKGVKVMATNKLDDNSAFMTVPFKNGKPINDPTMYLYNMSWNGETWNPSFKLTPEDADELVIRVEQGTIDVKIEHFDLIRD
jgi:hypothetical protein